MHLNVGYRCVLALAGTLAAVAADAQTLLLRFPDIAGDRVAFCYAGDLWTASAQGGSATRLTTHPGLELFPRFSPDGKWIAFTGQYEGDEQVYVMPAQGGEPRQLTFYPARGPLAPRHGYDNQVYGWTPDGESVLFKSWRDADGIRSEGALYTVPARGGAATALPMPTSGAGDFAPDGKRIVYSPLFRDFRTWKRYQGGWAQDLYLFDLASHEATVIAQSPRAERDPMWIGDAVYFSSDRDGTLNLYRYDLASRAVDQLTRSTTADVRWPSSDNRARIVYELGGALHVLDTQTRADTELKVFVPDDGVSRRPSRVSAAKQIEDVELSPKGERALFVARGDVFTVPIEKGPVRNLTRSSGAHDKWARWSPDGTQIAFVSDKSGEDEIYVVDQAGGEARALTSGGAAMRYAPAWSADGKRIAFSDKDGKLYVVTLADRKLVQVADDARTQIRDYTWSPQGAYLAFSMVDPNGSRSIHVWSGEDGKTRRVTDETWNEEAPAWSPDGEHLYYLSDREFAPQISRAEWNFAGNRQTGIFALTLKRDGPSAFPPQSDEVGSADAGRAGDAASGKDEKAAKDEERSNEKAKDAKKEKPAKPFRVDFEGLAERVTRAPIDPDNFDAVVAIEGHLLYVRSGAPFYGREPSPEPGVFLYSIKDRKEHSLATDVSSVAVSADGSKVLVEQGEAYNLYEARPDSKDKKTVSTQGLQVDRVPAEEWAQIFDEVWRRYRDFFYVANMHGYDWKAIGERYRSLLPHVGHRSDLNYVLGEMVSELNVGHAYIEGGDYEMPERPKVGLPGARFELDRAAGRYRVARIFKGHNQEERYRSPLTEVGVDVKVGDYVLAVDGVELKADDDPYRLLRHKTDVVTLTVNSKPSFEGARKTAYRPIASEEALLYLAQVERNRERVTELSGGRVAYIHVPDMGAGGGYEFLKWFYPQLRKQGLVVDVRSNGGGNISQWLIERLDTKLLGTGYGRIDDFADTYPQTVFHGPKVCLLNETSASDGDIFPYMFRQAGLGPLIGKRSWGGVVGIGGRGPLIDGGRVFVPEAGSNAVDGSWVIEGHGVDPDIVVENDPRSVIAGRDPQLERGVAEVLKALESSPPVQPSRPADPVKTR